MKNTPASWTPVSHKNPQRGVAPADCWNHRETRVTVTASLRDLDHDGRWSTYDENELKPSTKYIFSYSTLFQF